jgi:mannose-6-phosphate isomerase-like protein (cupin superfamily)
MFKASMRFIHIKEGARSAAMTHPTLRRIVTGHGDDGRSCIVSERTYRRGDVDVISPAEEPEFMLAELWRLEISPETDAPDLTSGQPLVFAPPAGGAAIKLCVVPSESTRDYSRRKEIFAAAGADHGFGENAVRHPGMHRTETVDFIVVISGRLFLVMDEGETLLQPGDVVIQRGTNHAWSNPDATPCLIAAIMLDAKPSQA